MTGAAGWERADFEELETDELDLQRLESLIAALEKSQTEAISPRDSQKIQQLIHYFQQQLQRRGRLQARS